MKHSNKTTKLTQEMDQETAQFAADVLESIKQAGRAEYAQVHTPELIALRRGRPVGSTKLAPKVQTAIRFDADVIAALRATGPGWQTRVNRIVKEWIKTHTAI